MQQCGAIKSFALFDNGVRGNTVQMLAKLNHDEACRLGKFCTKEKTCSE
jgi:hypothetical protein